MSSKKKAQLNALNGIIDTEFNFTESLGDDAPGMFINDCDNGTGPLLAVAASLESRVCDLRESAEDAEAHGEDYPVEFAKKQWLNMIAQYVGILTRRLDAGETLCDNASATAALRGDLSALRLLLLAIYGEKDLCALEKASVVRFR